MEPAPINPALKRRVQKVLATNVNDPNLLLALRNLSTFYTHNSQSSRWNLRDQLENKSLEVNNEVVEMFAMIDGVLEDLNGEIDSMSSACQEMQMKVDQVKAASGLVMQQANELFEAEELTRVQLGVVEVFLAKFSLGPNQVRAIRNNEVNQEFFDALRRVKEIHNDCRTLLVGESSQMRHRTGIEIEEAMNEHLEVAYRKLYRWVLNEIKFLEVYNDPDVSMMMVMAFEELQGREVLLTFCLNEVAKTRSKAVVDGFIDALTVGGPNGVPRPIDMHAHDPKRYIGDMAAFIHQALAAELELLNGGLLRRVGKEAFLSIRSSLSQQPSTNSASDGNPQNLQTLSDTTPTLSNDRHPHLHPQKEVTPEELSHREVMARLLDVELSGLCKPFASRVDQVFATNSQNPPLLYHLANLFYYYSRILSMYLDINTAEICKTMTTCRENAYKAFFRALGSRMQFLLHNRPPIPSPDLSPPHDFTEVVIMLQDMMKILETSIIPAEAKEFEALPILDRLVDPLLESCLAGLRASNATLKPGPHGMPVTGHASKIDPTVHTMEQVVYLINCHTSICKVLEKFPFCIVKLAHLKSAIDGKVSSLVIEQASLALRQCGLASSLAALRQYQVQKSGPGESAPSSLSQVPGMDPTTLRSSLNSFESDILQLGALSMTQIDKIEDDRVRLQARSSTTTMIAEAYNELFNAVSDADSGYDNPDAIMRYKPEQVRMMISS